jgi:gamma-glutamyltranspeptidase / glutathione hydrolase
VVSMTQTLIGGMTGLGVAGDTGVVMNCALQWFDPQPGAPNSVAPGKRPLSNMTPMIVERAGKPVLAVGAPGSRRITNAVSQVTLNVLEHGMAVQPAISAPRIDCSLGHILADDRIDGDTIADLRERGHRVDVVHEFINAGGPATGYRGNFSRPAAIHIDDDRVRHGGDYPFVEGMAVGVPRTA